MKYKLTENAKNNPRIFVKHEYHYYSSELLPDNYDNDDAGLDELFRDGGAVFCIPTDFEKKRYIIAGYSQRRCLSIVQGGQDWPIALGLVEEIVQDIPEEKFQEIP